MRAKDRKRLEREAEEERKLYGYESGIRKLLAVNAIRDAIMKAANGAEYREPKQSMKGRDNV